MKDATDTNLQRPHLTEKMRTPRWGQNHGSKHTIHPDPFAHNLVDLLSEPERQQPVGLVEHEDGDVLHAKRLRVVQVVHQPGEKGGDMGRQGRGGEGTGTWADG